MNRDVLMIMSLKRVFESVGHGSGLSRSMVKVLAGADRPGPETARLLLLGSPIASAMLPVLQGSSEEVAMLASLIVAAPKSSAPSVGKTGVEIASTLERWVKAKEARALEQKVMRFRSLLTSGVLGAVTAMIATIGPLVGSLGAGTGTAPGAGELIYAAAVMTMVSSGMLGAFMSGRGFYVNVVLSMVAFGLVYVVASPLAALSSLGVWGVK